MQSIIDKSSRGINAVIKTNTGKSYTYKLDKGEVTFKGVGTLYNSEFKKFGKSKTLVLSDTGKY